MALNDHQTYVSRTESWAHQPPTPTQDQKAGGNEALSRVAAADRADQRQQLRAAPGTAPPAAVSPPLQPPGYAQRAPSAPGPQSNAEIKAGARPKSLMASRSSTMPNLSRHASKAKPPPPPLALGPAPSPADGPPEGLEDPPSPSICHSPTWSLSPNAKSRKEEKRLAKERRKQEERARKEEQRRLALVTKTGRRLSKRPPPAAMETQRLPVGLAPPPPPRAPPDCAPSVSLGNTSPSGSRPSSQGERSSPATSLMSAKRMSEASHRSGASRPGSGPPSQPASPDEAPGGVARKRESQPGGEARVGAPRHTLSRSRDSNDDTADMNDFTDFAYQMDYPAQSAFSSHNTPRSSPHEASFPLHDAKLTEGLPSALQIAPGMSRPTRPRVEGAHPSSNMPQREVSQPAAQPLDAKVPNHVYPSFSHPRPQLSYRSRTFDAGPRPASEPYHAAIQPYRAPAPPRLRLHPDPAAAPHGYVRHQRLGQEQRSMAGFRDQLAVARANELLLLGAAARLPPTPDDSTESLHEATDASERGSARSIYVDAPSEPEPEAPAPAGEPSQAQGAAHQMPAQHVAGRSGVMEGTDVIQAAPQQRQEPKRSTTDPETYITPSQTNAIPPLPFQVRRSSPARDRSPSNPPQQRRRPPQALPHITHESHQPTETTPAPTTLPAPTGNTPEIVIEGLSGDGILRKTSLKRPRSDPELSAVTAQAAADPAPARPPLDFLPELKHQPLPKPKRTSLQPPAAPPSPQARVSFAPDPQPRPDMPKLPPRPASFAHHPTGPGLRPPAAPGPQRASAGPGTLPTTATTLWTMCLSPWTQAEAGPTSEPHITPGDALRTRPVAKMFVICCACKFWHDLPSRLYEAMALPRPIQRVDELLGSGLSDDGHGGGAAAARDAKGKLGKGGRDKEKEREKEKERPLSQGAEGALLGPAGLAGRVEGKVYTTVRCPWCEHPMSTGCCAGWTTIVYLHERHH